MAGKSTLLSAPGANLADRDPGFIRAMLPRLWLAASVWFRAEVKGLEKVPDEPVPIELADVLWVSPILLMIGAGVAAVTGYVTLRLYVRL